MVPIYSIVSFMSYVFYRHAVYYEVIRDCYEAFAIASFFALLCHYIAPDLHSQKDYFRGLQPRGWVWPLDWMKICCGGERGIWRTPRSGLTWFNVRASSWIQRYLGEADFIEDYLAWDLSILLRSGFHDPRRSRVSSCRTLLFRIIKSGIRTYLGTTYSGLQVY